MPSVPCAETRPPYWPSGAGHRRRGRTGGARVHEHVLPGAAEELGVDLSPFFSFIMISARPDSKYRAGVRYSAVRA